MRCDNPDVIYFGYLDGLRDRGEESTMLAPILLLKEFPCLHPEEAKAVCADWRATYHERHTRLA